MMINNKNIEAELSESELEQVAGGYFSYRVDVYTSDGGHKTFSGNSDDLPDLPDLSDLPIPFSFPLHKLRRRGCKRKSCIPNVCF